MCPIKFSVIVPVYNAKKYLRECLDSIVNQTLKEIEIVLVDDGSTDGCANICKLYLNDSRVKCLYKINEGPAAAHQYGIEHAQGEYIGFVDADDWVEPNMFEVMYSSAASKNADIVMCSEYIDNSKQSVSVKNGLYQKEEIKKVILPGFLAQNTSDKYQRGVTTWWHVYTKIYRKKFIVENRLSFNKNLYSGEDIVFSFKSLCLAKTLVAVFDSYLYHYRVNNNYSSITHKYRKDFLQNKSNAFSELKNTIDQNGLQHLIMQMNVFISFQAFDLLTNEWFLSKSRKNDMIKNLNEIVKEPNIKNAFNNVTKNMFNERNQHDYDILICESGKEMYKQLRQSKYYKKIRINMYAKRLFHKINLDKAISSKSRKKLSGLLR